MGTEIHRIRQQEFNFPFVNDNIKDKGAKVIREQTKNALEHNGRCAYVVPALIPGDENTYLLWASDADKFDDVESQKKAHFLGQSLRQNNIASGVQGSGIPSSMIMLARDKGECMICSIDGNKGFVTKSYIQEGVGAEAGTYAQRVEEVTSVSVPNCNFTYLELFKKFIGKPDFNKEENEINVLFLYKVIRTPNDAISLSGYKDKIITCGTINTFHEICEPGLGLDERFKLYYSVTNQGVGEYIINETENSPETVQFVALSDHWCPGRNTNKINIGITQEKYFSEFGRDKIDCRDFDVVYEYKDTFDSNIKIHCSVDLQIQMYPGFLRTTARGQGISRLCKLKDGHASHNSMESTERLFLSYKFLEKTFSGSSAERAFKDPVLWFNNSRINSFTSILGLNCNVNVSNPFKDHESWKEEYTWIYDKIEEESIKGRSPFVKFFIDIKDIIKIERNGEEIKNQNIFNFLGSYDAFFSMTSEESVRTNSTLIKVVLEAFSKQKEFSDFVELHKKYFPYDKSDEIKGDLIKTSISKTRSRVDVWIEESLSNASKPAKPAPGVGASGSNSGEVSNKRKKKEKV